MKKVTGVAFTALAFTALAVSAHAASFDCRKASTDIEQVICDDPDLSRLDSQMGRLYHRVRHLPGMKHEQKRWIQHRNNLCGSSDGCLIGETQDRIVELRHAARNAPPGKHKEKSVSKKEMYQMERACKNYMSDKFPDFPMAAFSVSWGHGKNGNFTIPVRFNWDEPRVDERGHCKIVNGKVVNYIVD